MSNKRDVEKFLATARKRFAQAEAEEADPRREAEIDISYVAGSGQWSDQVRRQREAAGRPCLTFNNLPTFVHQVSNEARQNKPQIKFSPAEDGDKDTAEIFEGLARQIQAASKADIAYETAVDYSASGGFGYFRLLADYCDYPGQPSLDQELKFAPIMDPFSVYGVMLPRMKGEKPRWAFVISALSREDYEAEYGESELASQGYEWGSQVASTWIGDEIRIAEYWYTEFKRRTWQLLSTGEKVYRDQYEELPEGVTVEAEREISEPTIRWCKTNGVEILEETTWVGMNIPIYAVLGWQLVVNQRYELYSLVRFMRDPQLLLNVYKSGIAEQIGLTNRVPYVGYKGQFKDPKWASANNVNYAYLEVEPTMIGGSPAPLPQRQQFEAPIQALSVAAAQEIDDLKRIAGIHDASLGESGNETSGIAIQRRQAQSGLINFHILGNLKRAQDEAGAELAYSIPRVYDTERMIRILGEDETQKVVRINAPWQDPETGEQKRYMLNAGRYDVSVEVGPAFSTKRQETEARTGQVIQAAPELMGVIGDIFFRNSDSAGASETAARVKKWISMRMPGLIDEPKQQQQSIPPQVQQQMQQLGQQHDALVEQVHALSSQIEQKKLELDNRLEIARINAETQRSIAFATIDQRDGALLLSQEIATLRSQLDQQHQMQMAEAAQDHQGQMADSQRQHEAAQAQAMQAQQAQAEQPVAEEPLAA